MNKGKRELDDLIFKQIHDVKNILKNKRKELKINAFDFRLVDSKAPSHEIIYRIERRGNDFKISTLFRVLNVLGLELIIKEKE